MYKILSDAYHWVSSNISLLRNLFLPRDPDLIPSAYYSGKTRSLHNIPELVRHIEETYPNAVLKKLECLNIIVHYFKKIALESQIDKGEVNSDLDILISSEMIDRVTEDLINKSTYFERSLILISCRYCEQPIALLDKLLEASKAKVLALIPQGVDSDSPASETAPAEANESSSDYAMDWYQASLRANYIQPTYQKLPENIILMLASFSDAHYAFLYAEDRSQYDIPKLAMELVKAKPDLSTDTQQIFDEAIQQLFIDGRVEYRLVYHADKHVEAETNGEIYTGFTEFLKNNRMYVTSLFKESEGEPYTSDEKMADNVGEGVDESEACEAMRPEDCARDCAIGFTESLIGCNSDTHDAHESADESI